MGLGGKMWAVRLGGKVLPLTGSKYANGTLYKSAVLDGVVLVSDGLIYSEG